MRSFNDPLIFDPSGTTSQVLSGANVVSSSAVPLQFIEGFSVQELAEILNLNVNTVKVRSFRARGRIMDSYRRRLASSDKSHAPAGQRKE